MKKKGYEHINCVTKRYGQWRKWYLLDIDPYFIPRSSLYYASKSEDVSFLQEEYNTLQNYGFAEYFTESDIKKRYPFIKQAALYTHGDAEVNPYLLAHSLLHKANQMGANIYEHTEAIHIKNVK